MVVTTATPQKQKKTLPIFFSLAMRDDNDDNDERDTPLSRIVFLSSFFLMSVAFPKIAPAINPGCRKKNASPQEKSGRLAIAVVAANNERVRNEKKVYVVVFASVSVPHGITAHRHGAGLASHSGGHIFRLWDIV